MLIAEINDEYIEVIAIDKTAGKLQNLYYPYNISTQIIQRKQLYMKIVTPS